MIKAPQLVSCLIVYFVCNLVSISETEGAEESTSNGTSSQENETKAEKEVLDEIAKEAKEEEKAQAAKVWFDSDFISVERIVVMQ